MARYFGLSATIKLTHDSWLRGGGLLQIFIHDTNKTQGQTEEKSANVNIGPLADFTRLQVAHLYYTEEPPQYHLKGQYHMILGPQGFSWFFKSQQKYFNIQSCGCNRKVLIDFMLDQTEFNMVDFYILNSTKKEIIFWHRYDKVFFGIYRIGVKQEQLTGIVD